MKDRNKAGQKSAAKYIWRDYMWYIEAIFGMIFSTNERERERTSGRERRERVGDAAGAGAAAEQRAGSKNEN